MHELRRDHPLCGREFDWLGIDRNGRVAVFSNAGYGPLPETVNERAADVDAALERADELPVIGSAGNVENSGDGDCSFWYFYSAKGFYAYDWRVWGGPYRRLSSPTVPVSIDRLPDQLQAVARLAVFPVDFADEPEIAIECLLTGSPSGRWDGDDAWMNDPSARHRLRCPLLCRLLPGRGWASCPLRRCPCGPRTGSLLDRMERH